MIAPDEKPFVKLIGEDGNAFGILGKVRDALRKAGADSEYINSYMTTAMSGDYDNLLATTAKFVDVG